MTTTRWLTKLGDILDEPADALICSANPQLNLSGGVGGAILLRYGPAMQEFLHRYLATHQLRHVKPGSVVLSPACGSTFQAVAHAVSIDVFYDTSPSLVSETYEAAIRALAERDCRTIVAACLGCGYGRLSVPDFAQVVAQLCIRSYIGVDSICLCSTNVDLVDSIRQVLQSVGR